MKYKHIVLTFSLILPLCVIIRMLVLSIMSNPNGFLSSRYRDVGMLFLGAFTVLVALLVGIACTIRRCPTKAPTVKAPAVIGSVLYSVVLAISAVADGFFSKNANVLTFATGTFGIIAAVAIMLYASSGIFKFKANGLFFAAVVIYYALRLICSFMVISTLSITFQNILWVLAEATQMLVLLQFGKIISEKKEKNGYKTTIAISLAAIVINASYALPNLLLVSSDNIVNKSKTFWSSSVLALAGAVFCAIFLFSYYGSANLKRHSSHYHRKKYKYDPTVENSFYMGTHNHSHN